MRPLRVTDAASIVLGLEDEIRRSEESRYDHRLRGVLLVAQAMTCPEVAKLLVRGCTAMVTGILVARHLKKTEDLFDSKSDTESTRRHRSPQPFGMVNHLH